jgi:hypothetical protein
MDWIEEIKRNWLAKKDSRFVEWTGMLKEYEHAHDIDILPFFVRDKVNKNFPGELPDFIKVYNHLIELFDKNNQSVFPLIPILPPVNSLMNDFISLADLVLHDKSTSEGHFKACDVSINDFIVKKSLFGNEWIVYNNSLVHPYAPDFIHELTKLGHSHEVISNLLPVLLYWFDHLDERSRYNPKTPLISTSIYLSCRCKEKEGFGGQCPAPLKAHYKSFSNVSKKFPDIRRFVGSNSFDKILNSFWRAKRVFGLDDDFIKTCESYFNIVRSHSGLVSNSFNTAAALIYIALLACDERKDQREVVKALGSCSENGLRNCYKIIQSLLISEDLVNPVVFKGRGMKIYSVST